MSGPINPTRVDVTRHALQRFRERIDGTADVAKVEALVREAVPAPKWMLRFVSGVGPVGTLLQNGIAVFLVVVHQQRHIRVITTMTVPFMERSRERYGKKRNKIRWKQWKKAKPKPPKETDSGGKVHSGAAETGIEEEAEAGDARRRWTQLLRPGDRRGAPRNLPVRVGLPRPPGGGGEAGGREDMTPFIEQAIAECNRIAVAMKALNRSATAVEIAVEAGLPVDVVIRRLRGSSAQAPAGVRRYYCFDNVTRTWGLTQDGRDLTKKGRSRGDKAV